MAVTTREEVKVLGFWASPYVMRVRIALNLKGVQYEYTNEQLENKSQLLLDSNPIYKSVPVLIHNGKCISESMIIVQYIDEVWRTQPSILPSDPYERSTALFWAVYTDDKLKEGLHILIRVREETTEKGVEIVTTMLSLLEEAFEKCSKGKEFFGGETIGYLDIALGSLLMWIKVAEKTSGAKLLDEAKIPQLVRWTERFCSHVAVKDVMPELDKLFEYSKALVVPAKIKVSATH